MRPVRTARHGLRGPFNALLRSPELCDLVAGRGLARIDIPRG
jgi:hypothetical protein